MARILRLTARPPGTRLDGGEYTLWRAGPRFGEGQDFDPGVWRVD
jgi:hypothetical protein